MSEPTHHPLTEAVLEAHAASHPAPEPYDLIISDPNWKYMREPKIRNWRSASKHYVTDPEGAMYLLNPLRAMARDSVLALWVTGPMIPRAFRVVDYWNSLYRYKRDKLVYFTVLFVWTKTTLGGDQAIFTQLRDDKNWAFGNGLSTRSNCEYVFGFRRGKGIPRVNNSVRQQIVYPRQIRNSEKPDETNFRLERLYGATVREGEATRPLRRAELYARRELPGWDCVGDQVPKHSRRIEDWLAAYPAPPALEEQKVKA